MLESNSPQRRVFTEEFKREAVRLANERANLCAVAKELGIHESVTQWYCYCCQSVSHFSDAMDGNICIKGLARFEYPIGKMD